MGFRSEAELDSWLRDRDKQRGYVGTLQAFYDMSKDWYSGRMEEDWEPLTAAEATELWARHGFAGSFWTLS